jgi:hypothetical protein
MFGVGQFVFAGVVQYVLDHLHLQPFKMVLHLDLVQEGGLESLAGCSARAGTASRNCDEVETYDRLERGTSIIPLMGAREYVSFVPVDSSV